MKIQSLEQNIKKRFVTDYKIPIFIYKEPYFTYFLDLYNKDYGIDEKIKWLEEVLADETKDLFESSKEVIDKTKEIIKNSESYKKFTEYNIKNETNLQINKKSIYIDENIGKKLISIDLVKANYSVFKMFGLEKELGISSYEDLISKTNDKRYYKNSKKIRQVIFGELNPKKQQNIQKEIIKNISLKLISEGYELYSVGSDEIILQSKNVENENEKLETMLKDFSPISLSINSFMIEKINSQYNAYVKIINDSKIEYKNIPSHLFAQIYKQYNKIPIVENDLLFMYEDELAMFKKSILHSNVKKRDFTKKG